MRVGRICHKRKDEARLDDCEIPYERLEDIQYVDLFPDWNRGLNQILQAME